MSDANTLLGSVQTGFPDYQLIDPPTAILADHYQDSDWGTDDEEPKPRQLKQEFDAVKEEEPQYAPVQTSFISDPPPEDDEACLDD